MFKKPRSSNPLPCAVGQQGNDEIAFGELRAAKDYAVRFELARQGSVLEACGQAVKVEQDLTGVQAHEFDGTCLEELDGLGNGAGVGGGTHGNAGLDGGAHETHVLGRGAALGSGAGNDVVGMRGRNGVDGLAEHLRS